MTNDVEARNITLKTVTHHSKYENDKIALIDTALFAILFALFGTIFLVRS